VGVRDGLGEVTAQIHERFGDAGWN